MGKINRNVEVCCYGRFFVSYKEYVGLVFLDYCSGGGFIFFYDVVECMVFLFEVINLFWIDDVYVGIIAYELGLILVYYSWFLFLNFNYDDCFFIFNVFV